MSWSRFILGGMLAFGVALFEPAKLSATPLSTIPLPLTQAEPLPVVAPLAPVVSLRPMARNDVIPAARWDHRADGPR